MTMMSETNLESLIWPESFFSDLQIYLCSISLNIYLKCYKRCVRFSWRFNHFTEKNKITWNCISARKSRTCGHHTRKTGLRIGESSSPLETVPGFWQRRNLPPENWSLCECKVQPGLVCQGRPNSHLVMIMRKEGFHRLKQSLCWDPVSSDCIQTVPDLPSASPNALLSIPSTLVPLRGCLRSLSNRPSHEMDFSACLQFC